MVDDERLINRMLAGDAQAFRLILDQHVGPISNYVNRMTNSSAETEDIVQETFVRLWSNRGSFNPQKARLTTWLHRIAHNLAIDNFRRTSRLEDGREALESGTTPGPEVEHEASASAKKIAAALQLLPERQRSAIIMCHYQELSNKEAAAILDVSVDALESLLARGRRKLREHLIQQEGESP